MGEWFVEKEERSAMDADNRQIVFFMFRMRNRPFRAIGKSTQPTPCTRFPITSLRYGNKAFATGLRRSQLRRSFLTPRKLAFSQMNKKVVFPRS